MKKAVLVRPVMRAESLFDGASVRRYLIVERVPWDHDKLLGGIWERDAKMALRAWRMQQQGKADI